MSVTIARAADAAGVGVETIRLYEQPGLIRQPPKPNGFRIYSAEIVERIQFIRQAQEPGFSLARIQQLLSLRASPKSDAANVRMRATAKLEEVEAKIRHLQSIRKVLNTPSLRRAQARARTDLLHDHGCARWQRTWQGQFRKIKPGRDHP